jgi:hypothetical protein
VELILAHKYSMYGIEQPFGIWEGERTLAHCAPCAADWKIASANSALRL